MRSLYFVQMMMEEGMIRDVFKSYTRYPVPVSASITTEKGTRFDTKTRNLTVSTGKLNFLFPALKETAVPN